MKKLVLALLLGAASMAYAKVNAVVSIVPQKYFLESIGGEYVNVSVMVLPGQSPHSYEPKPSQMKELSDAQAYFSIGIEFENAWLKKFEAQNRNMKMVDSSKGIERIAMIKHEHHDEHKHEKHDEHDALDSHVWLSTTNAKVIAKNILDALIEIDGANKESYTKNYEALVKKIDGTDSKIRETLSGLPNGAKFMVFHPSFGYFARDYGLTQLAIEVEGKEPKPKELKRLIDEAKEEKVSAIITSPEFSKKAAETVAKEVGVSVKSISPLSQKWSETLIELAKIIANK